MTFRNHWLLPLSLLALSGCPESNSRGDTGVDAPGSLPDAVVRSDDAYRPATDAGAVSCAPMEAEDSVCPELGCDDGPPIVVWDGERCVSIDCGACVGADCSRAYPSVDACTTAHRSCVPELCRATGGDWLFWAEECDHLRCGNPVPALCIVGMPVCDCGARSVFDPVLGCVASPECDRDGMPSPEALCTSSGGTWEGVCAPSRCGVPSPLACAALACTCGPLQVWDDARGCVDSSLCHDNRPLNETCTTDGDVRCGEGLICCQSCGGAGCFGDPTCRTPTCDATGELDVCGNNRFAP